MLQARNLGAYCASCGLQRGTVGKSIALRAETALASADRLPGFPCFRRWVLQVNRRQITHSDSDLRGPGRSSLEGGSLSISPFRLPFTWKISQFFSTIWAENGIILERFTAFFTVHSQSRSFRNSPGILTMIDPGSSSHCSSAASQTLW